MKKEKFFIIVFMAWFLGACSLANDPDFSEDRRNYYATIALKYKNTDKKPSNTTSPNSDITKPQKPELTIESMWIDTLQKRNLYYWDGMGQQYKKVTIQNDGSFETRSGNTLKKFQLEYTDSLIVSRYEYKAYWIEADGTLDFMYRKEVDLKIDADTSGTSDYPSFVLISYLDRDIVANLLYRKNEKTRI